VWQKEKCLLEIGGFHSSVAENWSLQANYAL
jgi:hypothetical protein